MIDELIACQPDPRRAAKAHFAAATLEGALTLANAFLFYAALSGEPDDSRNPPADPAIGYGIAVILGASTLKFGSSTFKHIVNGRELL